MYCLFFFFLVISGFVYSERYCLVLWLLATAYISYIWYFSYKYFVIHVALNNFVSCDARLSLLCKKKKNCFYP